MVTPCISMYIFMYVCMYVCVCIYVCTQCMYVRPMSIH